MPTRITMADVARECEVSIATVSMALSGRGSISEVTVQRVRAAAARLGYVPDATARSLRTGRSSSIGFISDEVTVTRFASAMVRGILDSARDHGQAVLMMETGRDPARLAEAFEALQGRQVDAIAVGLMDSALIDLPPTDIPLVMVNGCSPGHPAILPDEFRAGRRAVELLLERGHRHIGVVGMHPTRPEPRVSVNIGIRMDGITTAMGAAGLGFADHADGTVWEPDLGHAGTHAMLDRTPHITAILALNDRIAFGVQQALTDRGLRVPDDVSIMSFDDEPLAGLMRPGLTTLHLPYREMGRRGVDLLLGPPLDADAVHRVPLELVERGSLHGI